MDTGSKVQGQTELACTHCSGFGWTGPRRQSVPAVQATPALVAEGNGPVGTEPLTPDPPEVAALKRQGYTIIEPVR